MGSCTKIVMKYWSDPDLRHEIGEERLQADREHKTDALPVCEIQTDNMNLYNDKIEGKEPEFTLGWCVTTALMFGAVSTSLAFIDKILLSVYNFRLPFMILTCQICFTIVVIELLRCLRLIEMPSYSKDRGLKFLLPSTFFWLNAVLSLIALSGMNIPMFGTVRRCEPLALLLLSVIVMKRERPSFISVLGILMITMGCILAGYGDLNFDLNAYACGLASIFSQAFYLILIESLCKSEMSTMETLHLNSYNTFPFLLGMALVKGEHQELWKYEYYRDWKFISVFICVITFGCLLNYTMFLCTSVNSALTTSVVGTLKSVCQSILGLYTFGGVTVNFFTGWGLFINLCGGLIYTVARYRR